MIEGSRSLRAQAGVAPAEALAIGLVHHVVPRQEFDSSAIATMSTPRAEQDMDKYAAELAKHDASTDGQILDVWQATLATGSCAARRQVVHDR